MSARRLAPYLAAFAALFAVAKRADLERYLTRPSRHFVAADLHLDRDVSLGTWTLQGLRKQGAELVLPAGKKGRASFEFSKPAGHAFDLWPIVARPPGGSAELTLEADRLSAPVALLRGREYSWSNILFELPPPVRAALEASTRVKVTVEARNPSAADAPVLSRLSIRAHDAPRRDFLVVPLGLGCLLLLGALLLAADACVPRYHAAACASLALAGAAAWAGPDVFSSRALPALGSLGLLALAWKGRLPRGRALLPLSLLWTAWAARYWWGYAAENPHCYFHESVDSWTAYGRAMRLFTDAGFFSATFGEREPLYVLVVHLWGLAFGPSTFAHLNLTLLLVTACSWFSVWAVGRRLGDDRLLLLLAPALAVQPHFEESIDAFQREPLFYLLMLGFLYAATAATRRPAALTALAAAATLTRNLALGCFAAAAAAAALCRLPFRARDYVFFLGTIVALQVPLALNTRRLHGDASYHVDRYARFNANSEFPERLGTPGFPTAAQHRLDSYAGPKITYREYLFGLHTPWQLARQAARGLADLTARYADYVWTSWGLGSGTAARLLVFALLAAGLAARPGLAWGAAWFVALNWYSLQLFSVGLAGRRHVDHALPVFLLLVGLSLKALSSRAAR